jgi:hypothetical protein
MSYSNLRILKNYILAAFCSVCSDKSTTNKLKKLRLKGKDFKKGGEALRGKNVIEAYRVKEKEMKRTMK